MMRVLAAAALAAFFMSAPPPAAAHVRVCVPADRGDAELRARHGETPVGRGVSGGRLVLLYTAREGASWTVVEVDPRTGLLCVLAAGEGWEAVDRPREREPS